MSSTKQLKGIELINYLEANGIVHEINRTFLHPLGLDLRVNNDEQEIEFYQTDDPKGFLLERINKMYTQVFNRLSVTKHTMRQKELGFGIQTKDTYRIKDFKEIQPKLIQPERMKVEEIVNQLSKFTHMVYTKIVKKHKIKDTNLDPNQFDESYLLESLMHNLNEEDWIDVAAFAMMLHQRSELAKAIEEINTIAKNRKALDDDDI
jgi:hypothetical protein